MEINKRTERNKEHQYETSEADIQNAEDDLPRIFKDLEHEINTFQKKELERFQKILRNGNIQDLVKDYKDRNQIREAFLDITLHFLRCLKQDEHADKLEDELVYICKLKSNLEKRCQRVFEGITNHGDSTLLNKIYTDLYITQGGGEQINTEHEIRQIEVTSRHLETSETQIEFRDLFKPHERDQNIRSVLTKGVAGIGKSFSVQKFVLDWAEGKENQDISFIFPLPFRELNLKDKERVSLMDLIIQFFPEIKGLNLTRKKVLLIFDGLDECRLPLKFDSNEILRDVTSPASLDVLLTNLIKGYLFPSALIWITTRPAAASKIIPECIDRVTEVRGFNDAQKVEYFRKRFTDENMANTIIDHVKKSKSLFIMCHIPVFCWISATVLQNILEKKRNNQSDKKSEDTPKTLTQMYTHFFRFQIQQSRRKYEGEYSPDICWDKDVILSLGKLAFQNLEKSNLIFYDSDLEACGIDITKASVYSGMCTQIFKQETGIITGTMYCFVHLSIQEFTAALYAHLFLDMTKKNVFVQDHTGQENNETMIGLLKTAVDKALDSENGHLDLFLRFLLGLTLESSRPLLRGLLTQEESNEQSNKKIVEYIKLKFNDNSSAERSINLFYCLNELNDQSLVKEIQKHLNEGSLSSADLSPAQWSALVFVLLTSEEEMEVFELQKFKKSDECLIRLSPVVKTAKKALLNDCYLTDKGCSAIAKVLGSDSHLTEVNMSNNKLKDSGVKLLCDGLMNTKCELKILRLNKCELTEKSCSALSTVLSSDFNSLKELDLNNNNLQDSGVKLLSDGLMNVKCGLEILSLSRCNIGEEGYVALYSAVRSNPSHLIELDLRGNDPGESGVKLIYQLIQDQNCTLKKVRLLQSPSAKEAHRYLNKVVGKEILLQRDLNLNDHKLQDSILLQICDLLKDKHCRLNKLILSGCGLTEESCSALASVLRSKPGLKELDMSNNNLQDSGVKKLHNGLQNTNCQLHKLRLSGCGLTEESCSALASVLRSKSGLKELDMSNNNLQDSGVKKLHNGLENTNCQLHKLSLSCCSIGEEGYVALCSAVRSNPSHLTELDLSGNDPGESGVKLIYDLIQDPKCALKTVRLLKSSSAVEVFKYLSETLGINPLLQRELNLSKHKLNNTRVKQICDLLKDKHCRLNTLRLGQCGLKDEVFFAVRLNPSHLKQLDLGGNKLGDVEVESLCFLLGSKHVKLETLGLCGCSITEKHCVHLISALYSNPSHLRELNLSENKLKDSGIKHLCHLLKHSDCKLEKLKLCGCSIENKRCYKLISALCSNPSHLRELNFSRNKIKDSGVKHLCDLLNNSDCRLEKLNLNKCKITDVDSLATTLADTTTTLRFLDLGNNKIKDTSLNQLHEVLKRSNCELS
nr:NACHT, LRR and PYD domains-containing protein 12-like [Misgurnus anguillicaudatus]